VEAYASKPSMQRWETFIAIGSFLRTGVGNQYEPGCFDESVPANCQNHFPNAVWAGN
jgi:hypothetical protein